MSPSFTINGTEFWINNDERGFVWRTNLDEGDFFPTALEAQQDAMNSVIRQIREDQELAEQAYEDAMYGSYEDQVHSLWRSQRGC